MFFYAQNDRIWATLQKALSRNLIAMFLKCSVVIIFRGDSIQITLEKYLANFDFRIFRILLNFLFGKLA